MALPSSGAISLFDVNTELGLTNSAQLGLLCTNVRTLFGDASGAVAMFDGYGKSSTTVPGAPTIGTATQTGSTTATISFTAPASNGGATITSYTATSSPGGITGTLSQAGSGTISVSGLTAATAYTFTVYATNSKGNSASSSASNSITTSAYPSSALYTGAGGTYTWYAPTGVTSISVVLIAGGRAGCGCARTVYCPCEGVYYQISGAGGGGGGLAYKNNITVTPGTGYTLHVGVGRGVSTGYCCGISSLTIPGYFTKATPGCGRSGGTGYFSCGNPGNYGGSGGSAMVTTNNAFGGGGGGAGGYGVYGASGNGGCGGTPFGYTGTNGAGGGGNVCYGGGGTGIYGKGAYGNSGSPGYGGSGGSNGSGRNGGIYGAGGAGASPYYNTAGTAAGGAVRIIWPGNTRSYPSTCVGSP